MEKIIESLSNFAWPLAIVIILVLFKNQIRNLIDKVTGISYKNVEIRTSTQDEKVNVSEKIFKKEAGTDRLIFDRFVSIFSDETIKNVKKTIGIITAVNSDMTSEEREKALERYTIAIYLVLNFQSIYTFIYGSQLSLLLKVNSSTSEDRDSLISYYESAKKKYPVYYEDYSFDEYLKFLFTSGLIVMEAEKIRISQYGRDFLKYLTEAGISFEKSL